MSEEEIIKELKNIHYIKYLQKENQNLKEIEKEHQKINGELREENKRLKEQLEINHQAFDFNLKTIKKHNKKNNILNELEKELTPDYEEYKKLIDKRDSITDLIDMYWLGVAETSEFVLDKLKELKGKED